MCVATRATYYTYIHVDDDVRDTFGNESVGIDFHIGKKSVPSCHHVAPTLISSTPDRVKLLLPAVVRLSGQPERDNLMSVTTHVFIHSCLAKQCAYTVGTVEEPSHTKNAFVRSPPAESGVVPHVDKHEERQEGMLPRAYS